MLDTMTRYLTTLKNGLEQRAIRSVVKPLVDRMSSQPLTSAGLVIHGAASLVAKTGAADFYASVQGVLVKIAAATDMPALTGINFAAGNFQVACFYLSSAGTLTALGGTQGTTLAGVVFPPPPDGQALVGFLILTYASAFTGGTTALDTATTVYVSPLGPFDPTVLV